MLAIARVFQWLSGHTPAFGGFALGVVLAPVLVLASPADLVVMLEAAPATLDPLRATDAYGVRISNQLLFETLLTVDDGLQPAPGVATAWERLSPVRLRLEIRSGITFQDGTPLEPADVVYTLESLMDPEGGSPYRAALREKIKSVRVVPPRGVEVELQAPYASILADLVVPVRSRRAGPKQPLNGSGPYRLAGQSPAEIVLERNPRYHGPPPGPERVVFKVVQDESTRMLKFLKGDVDLAINVVPLDQIRRFRAPPLSRRYQVLEGPGLSYQYLGFNLADPALRHGKVRRAIAHAIDVEALIKHRQKGHALRAFGLMPPGSPYASREPPPAFDPALARRLLDEAGFPEKEGGRFTLTYKTTTDRAAVIQARVIQANLRKVGITVDVRSYEWATFYDDIQRGNFQLYSLRWIGVIDPDFQYELFHSSRLPPQGRNRGRYASAEMDRLLEAGRREADPERRKALYGQVNELLQRDLPYVSLWHNNTVVVVSRRFSGFRVHPSGGFQHLPEMRLERER
jgi:peptide/nickel transport system substrate-binding protein